MSVVRLAIFVGGKSMRMGTPKGLLRLPGGGPTILQHLADLGAQSDLGPFLVGDAEAYADVAPDLPRVEDDPQGIGPLGGLRASLRFAKVAGAKQMIAVACDMPYLDGPTLRALAEHADTAPVVAACRHEGAPWEPMLARYDVAAVTPVLDEALSSKERSFQRLFARFEVAAMSSDASVMRALRDWDTPDDVVS